MNKDSKDFIKKQIRSSWIGMYEAIKVLRGKAPPIDREKVDQILKDLKDKETSTEKVIRSLDNALNTISEVQWNAKEYDNPNLDKIWNAVCDLMFDLQGPKNADIV